MMPDHTQDYEPWKFSLIAPFTYKRREDLVTSFDRRVEPGRRGRMIQASGETSRTRVHRRFFERSGALRFHDFIARSAISFVDESLRTAYRYFALHSCISINPAQGTDSWNPPASLSTFILKLPAEVRRTLSTLSGRARRIK